MKKLIALLLVLSCVLLVACGEKPQTNEKDDVDTTNTTATTVPSTPASSDPTTNSTTTTTPSTPILPEVNNWPAEEEGGYDLEYSFHNSDDISLQESKLSPRDIYDSIEYVPQMFYGIHAARGMKSIDEFVDSVSQVPFTNQYGDPCEITTVPYMIQAGPKTLNDGVPLSDDAEWCILEYIIDGSFEVSYVAVYTVSGDIITFTVVEDGQWDEKAGQFTSYELSDITFTYRFRFEGFKLILSNGKDMITLYAHDYSFGWEDSLDEFDFSATCETAKGDNGINGTDELHIFYSAMYDDDGIGSISVENDERFYLEDVVAYMGKNGHFRMAVLWYDSIQNFEGIFFYCGNDGMILCDDKNVYYFMEDPYDQYRDELEDNLSEEDKDKLDDLTDEELEVVVARKQQLLTDLTTAFSNADLDISIDEITGEVVLSDSILFGVNEYNVSAAGKAFLKSFIEIYSSVVFNGEYDDFVSTILVEGHTDTSGDYDYNLTLSQNRADSVRDYCLSSECNTTNTAQLSELMEAVGYSYDDPIYDNNGNVDLAASRRVSFRLLINIG